MSKKTAKFELSFHYLLFCANLEQKYLIQEVVKMKNKKFLVALVGFLALFLAGCAHSSQKKQNTLPSAKTILTNAQKTKFKSMHANWAEKSSGKIMQKAEAQYVKNPTVVYTNVSTTGNHYKMWIEGKNNYIQMKGTSTNRWFKTKLSKNSSYSVITDNLNNMLVPFTDIAKIFKVKRAGTNYVLIYQGNSKEIWNAIISDSAITSLIGIDLDDVKPIKHNIKIDVDHNYSVNNVKVASTYKDDGKIKTFTMNADQINQIKQLSVPNNIKKSAVDLGKLDKK